MRGGEEKVWEESNLDTLYTCTKLPNNQINKHKGRQKRSIYLASKIVIYSANTQHLGCLKTLGSGEYAEDKVFDVEDGMALFGLVGPLAGQAQPAHHQPRRHKDVEGTERGFATGVAQGSRLS